MAAQGFGWENGMIGTSCVSIIYLGVTLLGSFRARPGREVGVDDIGKVQSSEAALPTRKHHVAT